MGWGWAASLVLGQGCLSLGGAFTLRPKFSLYPGNLSEFSPRVLGLFLRLDLDLKINALSS